MGMCSVCWFDGTRLESEIERLRAEVVFARQVVEAARVHERAMEAEVERLRAALELYRGQVDNRGNHSAADALAAGRKE